MPTSIYGHDAANKKTSSSPLGPEDVIVHAVLFSFLMPVGNAFVPRLGVGTLGGNLNPGGSYTCVMGNLSMPISV